MVFESLVTDLVNKFLGDFIENLDKSQLKLGIWGGDVVLNNLFVKENAFDELDLPLKVLHGNIGNLTLKIPWSNLYGAPVIANLDGLYVVAVPNLGVKYNAEKEAKAEWDTKQKELSRIEEAKKLQNEKKSEPKADTFAEKMVTQVIKNLQVNITNIHIRFEDHFTNPQRPFSIGVTLNELSFLTTDENWKPAIIKDTVSVIYKMVKLESLALYWNSKTASYLKLNRSQILEKLKHNIAAPGKNLSYQYLIKPITSSAQLRLHTKPENDNYSLPKILLNVLLEEIAIVLAKKQYHDIMELLESFERMTLASKYRKYRPDVTQKKGNAKQWWKFAYRCILEETVKRRRRMWSWSHISSHRRMTKSYKVAYKQKLTAKKPPADLTTKLEYLEKSLNVFDITLARQQAELEVKSEGLKKKKEAAEKGWFGGWFGGGGKKEELKEADASIGDKFEKLMTPEEKAKLYDAIGYQEDAGDVSLPKEFVANCVNVALKSLSLTLKDTDKKHAQVSRIAINDVSASIDQRPAANALKVDGSIQLLTVEGMPVSDQHTPMLLKPQSHNFIQADGNSNVVELGFETNPLDGACDQRVKLTAKPMEIIYDANTVNEIASFFKPPESVYLKQLQASAMAKFEELKEQTASGLQHAIEQHKYTDIHVDIQPTCVLVPDTGVYRQDAKLIIADLGSLSIKSEKPDKTVDIQTTDIQGKLSFEEVMSRAYEHFYVNLTSIQVLYALPGEDWRQACTQGISSLHVLQPMSLKINLSKSILQDPKIPKMRVDGELPSISVSMSDVRLHQILDLVRSIPLPEPDPSQPPGDTALHGDTAGALHDPYAIDVSNVAQSGNASSVVRKLNAGLDDSSSSEDEYYDASSKPAKKAIASKKSQEYTNCIDVQLKFVIKEISLSLLERKKNLDVPMMKVVLDNIGTQVKVTTFHLKTEVYLGGVYVQHQQFKAVNGGPLVNLVNTPTDDNNNKLLTVVYMKANKKNPEFSTTYKNTEQSITVDFTAIELLLHQEALLSVMKFAQSLQPPESPQPTPTDTSPTAATDNKEPSELNEIGKQLAEARRERLMLEEGDVIDLSVSAHLGTINVAVCTEKSFITDVNIKGLQADVMMQKAKIAVSAGLEDIAVFDPTPNAVYSKILTIDGTGVFSAAVTVYNFATKGAGYSDMNNVDTDVKLDTGCMNIVFLNKFVMQILCFLDQFQAAKDAMAEASSAVAESAVSAAQDLAQKSPRIKLDITLKAPVIVVPQSSTSDNALIIDLGDLHLANRFTAIQSQLSSDPAVIDSMDIKLNSVQVTRSIMKRQRSTADVLVLHPVNISLGLHRNLSASWYRKKPEIDVTAKLQSFSVALSQGDFTMIMSVLNENLTEGTAPPRREDSVVAGAPAQDTLVEEPAGEEKGAAGAVVNGNRTAGDVASTKAETPDKAAVYTKLKFNCQLQQINATLYNGNSNLNEGSATRDAGESLGFFGLHTISVDGVMMSDSSMEANVQLTKCVLDDTRPGREAGITRMMDQSQATATKCPHMIDVAFKQTSTLDKKLNVQVNGLYVCVCLEYLMSVGDFFTKGLPQQPPTTAAASPTDQLATVKPAATNAAQPPPSSQQTGGEMEIQLVVEKPEIILVEDTMDLNTNALVLNTHVVFKLRQTPDQQTMMGIVQNLQVVACRYAPEKREASKILILNPTDISLQSSTPTGDGMHMEIMVTDIIINVSPATIRTITATLSGLTAKPSVGNVDPLDAIPKDLWLAKSIKDVNVWYLKTANEEIDHIGLIEAEEVTESFGRGEQMLMTVSKIVVKFEGGVGNRTLPLLITEMTFRGEVKDWSSKLYVSSELTMEVAYYNETLAVWEPLVEPTEVDNGKLLPWEVNAEVIQNIEAYDTSEDGESATLPLPQTVINVVSDRALEITITKKSLEVINNLSKCFSDAYNLVETSESSDAAVAPYVLCNKSGLDVIATLDKQSFMPYNGNTKLTLASNEPVRLHEPEQEQATSKFSKQSVIKKTQTDVTKRITLQVEQYQFSRDINIVRAERRAFVIHKGNKGSDSFHLVSNTSVSYGCKTVTLGSILTVENNLPYTVEFYNKLSGSTLAKCGEVSSKSEVNVPFSAVYAQPQEIYFAIAGQRYGQSTKPVAWSKMSSGSTQVVTCNPPSPDHKAFYFNVTAEIDKIFSEKTDNKTVSVYKLILTPHVVFRNLLPVAVTCLIENNDEAYAVEGGKTIPLHEAKHSTTLDVKIGDYLDKEWRAFLKLDPKTPQMSVCTFEAHENMAKVSMDLGIHCVTVAGSLTFSLYCPYWMVNKTGQQLTYKRKRNKKDEAGEDFTMMHPPDHQGALLFSFKSQSFVSKNQTSVKVGESDWSEKFSLDTVGSAGTVTCKVKDGQHQAPSNPVKGMVEHLTPFTGTKYKVGVKNTLSSAGLTKIVVFTPYFMLVNHSPFGISVRENSNMAFWVDIPAGECVPFWPALTGKEKMMVAKVQDTDLETPTFKYAEPHTSLLKLDNQYGGINVEVQVMEDSTQIVFQHYQNGSASVLLINHSSKCPVEYVQNNVRDSRQRLSPGDMILYTWQEPSSKRELLWSCGETQNRVDTLVKDGIGDCFYDSDTKMYWVSFLDGMQRVLLFTEDLALATVAQQAGELERVDQEINLSLKGMGLSLVNNDIQKEIAYMAISSSGVVWEMRKKRRYKALKVAQSQQIEAAYQLYVAHIATGQTVQARQQLPGKIDVDFGVEPVMMYKPTKGAIRRSYQNGIQVTYRTSPHQTQFHAKIHRLQLDNQLSGAIFNTVLAPVPPPKSVTAESVPKPFTEVSIMIRKRDYSSVMQFKYAKILIQEMTLKVDQGFINALLALFAAGAITEDERYQQFKEDCKLPFSELGEDAAKSSAGELKNYYDNLHFSPLKIHLSFSLYGASGDDGSAVTQEQKSNVLNIFLQSVGVVLSDIQDVVFKLGYFERNYSFYNQSQLTSEIGGHYAQQAIKQMYVLVLGLDVLGNPFGLIRGMAEGIEDLFYEPYQGAIQGPEEFAEGLALGVRSLFGHAVGGAAGAVSRITGALGKGIATLTLDDDYQKQRREALAKRPTDFKEGFARGGKGLVMGVVGGVTGIVTKPMEGAKQEGVEGFFKGMGKGLVGAFTRPASGMVDFASTSFEGIRRAAELSEEVRRLRPPRYIQKDAIIRPYNFVQAEGNDILKDLEKGAYAKTDMYVYHVIVTKDMKNVLLVTNKRVVFVNKGEFLGQWDCEWQYTWNELKEPPTLTSKGLQFLLKEKQKKSFFSSGTVGKIVPIPNAQMAEIITKRIHEVMQQQA